MVTLSGKRKYRLFRYRVTQRDGICASGGAFREYLPQFLNPDRGDVILNPLDARMPYWNPAHELLHHSEAETIAKSLFPDRDRENRFFVESPRKLFAHLLKHHPTPEKLCYWIAHPYPEIDRRVAGTPLEAIVSKAAPQQRAGVRQASNE